MIKKVFIALILLSSTAAGYAVESIEGIFAKIYKQGAWGRNEEGKGSSGWGSTMKATEEYRLFLENMLAMLDIKTVVDVGCGDWEFSQAIDWDGIDYLGIDVVREVIARNKKKYASDNINFMHGDALTMKLPEADLLICKEVLQHLTNADIIKFSKQLSKFKYCLITNDISRKSRDNNIDIPRGYWRCIDLMKPPFNFKGLNIFSYTERGQLKQVLLIENL